MKLAAEKVKRDEELRQ